MLEIWHNLILEMFDNFKSANYIYDYLTLQISIDENEVEKLLPMKCYLNQSILSKYFSMP